MATNATLVQYLAAGIVDASGAALASGNVRFYEPGTTTPISAYSDAAASSTISQPLVLGADGRGKAYTLVPCRIVVKDSTDTTTIFDSDYAANIRDRQVLITHPNVNSGSEISLYDFLTDIGDTSENLYQEGASATVRTPHAWLRETHVSVVDHNATGDDTADDLGEMQAAIDRVLAADRTDANAARSVVVTFPAGTWRHNGALTITVASGTKQIILRGQGPKRSILKQYSTSANGLTINYSGGSTDCRTVIEGLGFTCSTTSSGDAIEITNGNKITIRNCEFGLYRQAIDASGATGARIYDCEVVSTDGNAAAIGIKCGTNTVIRDVDLAGSSSNGTAISSATADTTVDRAVISGWSVGVSFASSADDSSAERLKISSTATGVSIAANRCRVDKSNITATGTCVSVSGTDAVVRDSRIVVASSQTGVSFTGADCTIRECIIAGSSATAGISIGANAGIADNNKVTGCTTGITVGAHDDCQVTNNRLSSNTTDISIDASATDYRLSGNIGTNLGSDIIREGEKLLWGAVADTSGSGASPSWTPSISGTHFTVQQYRWTGHTAPGTLTINATSTTGLRDGDVLILQVMNQDTADALTVSANSQYATASGLNTLGSSAFSATVAAGQKRIVFLIWSASGSEWREQFYITTTAS